MNNFKIVKEQEHQHTERNLYVVLFKQDGSYGLDIANSGATLGRAILETKDQAEYLFNRFNDLIADLKHYVNSCHLCLAAFSYKTFKEMVLFLHAIHKIVDKGEMYSLIYMLGMNKEEYRNENTDTHRVTIREPGSSDDYGMFVKLKTNKYTFCFGFI